LREALKADGKENSSWKLCKVLVIGVGTASSMQCGFPSAAKKAVWPWRKELGAVLHELARQKECPMSEGHLPADHVYTLISIAPKYAAAEVISFLCGRARSRT